MNDLFGNPSPIDIDIQRLTEEVLKENPEARDNDMILYAEVWKKQGFEMPKGFEKAAKAETIGRHRRYCQQNGYYESKKKVGRQKAEEQYRDSYGRV